MRAKLAIRFGEKSFCEGDIVTIRYEKPSEITGRTKTNTTTGRIYKIDALNITVDCSMAYKAEIRAIAFSWVKSIEMATPRELSVMTSLGEIYCTKSRCDMEGGFPGIEVCFIPKAKNLNPDYEAEGGVCLALVEVVEPETGVVDEPVLHVRPYYTRSLGERDEDGQIVSGRISMDAPTDDFIFVGKDFRKGEET